MGYKLVLYEVACRAFDWYQKLVTLNDLERRNYT